MIRLRPLVLALLMTSTAAVAEGPKLIPMPASIEAKAGTLTIGEGAGIVAGDAGAKIAAKLLAQQVKVVRGLSCVGCRWRVTRVRARSGSCATRA